MSATILSLYPRFKSCYTLGYFSVHKINSASKSPQSSDAFDNLSSSSKTPQTQKLYLVLFTEEKLLNRLVNKYRYLKAPCSKLSELNQTNIGSYLHRDDLSEYETIYKNYLYIRNQKVHDDKIKKMMYLRIIETIKLKNITNYRIYTTLNLNPGNANAFLKNGDICRVSLDTTRRILQFVNEY